MNEPDAQTAPNYVTCSCQHCGGKIEFDANQLDPTDLPTVPCPHCELQTTIFVPEEQVPPVVADEIFPSSEVSEIENGESSSKQNNQENSRTLGFEEAARRAIRIWRSLEALDRAAKNGDHLAQWAVGMKFLIGEDVAQDDQEAVKWFRKSAEQGNSQAQLQMAHAYALGRGVTKDYSEAAKWCRLLAEQGNAFAQSCLADYYRCGEGVPKDTTEAIKWYRLSAEQGNANAQFFLGEFYRCGEGVPTDFTEAAKWYRKAAEQGDAGAQFSLGLAYLFGRGVAKDKAEVTRWHRLAAEQGKASAQLCLSVAYFTGDGAPQNYVEAYKWANLAAAQGKEKAEEAKKFRDELIQKMTPAQIEEGQRLSSIEILKKQNPRNQTLQEAPIRMAISSEVRREVWRRDGGVCVKCGSRLNLEYDHIVPVSKGGSNTARNIELLCQACNRAKSAAIQ